MLQIASQLFLTSPPRHNGGMLTLNPTYEASKGMAAQALLNNERWIQGPEFLKQPEEAWPQRPTDMNAKRSFGQRYVFGRSRFFTDGAFSDSGTESITFLELDTHLVRRKPPFDSNLPIFFYCFISFTSFSGHGPAQRERPRTKLIGPMQGAIPTQSHNP